MIKRIIFIVVTVLSLIGFYGNMSDLKADDCPHTFQIIVINDHRFLYEYSCDGTLIEITEIEE